MTISEEMVELAARVFYEAEWNTELVPFEGDCRQFSMDTAREALTAALQGSVVVPAEVTDEMRYATWKAQALHVGATELEAIQMANRRMTAEQRAMDQAAYHAMLAVAPSVSRHDGKDGA